MGQINYDDGSRQAAVASLRENFILIVGKYKWAAKNRENFETGLLQNREADSPKAGCQ